MEREIEVLMQQREVYRERYDLAMGRIREIASEKEYTGATGDYFQKVAEFLILLDETRSFLGENGLEQASMEELETRNEALYRDIQPENYERSYTNPAYAVSRLGGEKGEKMAQMLSFLFCEMRSLIPFVYENRLNEMVIRLELFVEIYSAMEYADEEEIRQIIYWFVSDYTETAVERHLEEMLVADDQFAVNLIKTADLSDSRYLYAYGEYVGENELLMADFMAGLPEEKIHTMADTYTEGYRIGFAAGNKDLSKKTTVEIRYQLGFERMMRRAVENFEKMGLQVVCYRAAGSILYNPSLYKVGFYGGVVNRQYEFDHKDDKALFFDKVYMNHKLEVTRTAFEKLSRQARGYAGPAVLETFGEKDFAPKNKPQALKLSEEQNELLVEYRTLAGQLQRQYILEEERSFTIIAFPMPEIRESFTAEVLQRVGCQNATECYRSFFEEVIRINTLDYKLYQRIQQTLIDALDKADYCVVKGMGENHTDLRVNLWKLGDPSRETIFENCVADVNIPVGEVFTSPVLKGTDGVLHVSRVYLNGLEYKNLELKFENGKIAAYSCSNFETEEENRKFVWENVLFRHKTLPIGEFAIGTNTVAYMAAQRYGVQDKFPILIAEKTGPHFAVGDTCYSHAEEVRVFNPDGKEIVAKDNEVARLREKAPEKAYFNCHTDITIPYNELGELSAVSADGEKTVLIQNGRFVLAGTEELNKAFAE